MALDPIRRGAAAPEAGPPPPAGSRFLRTVLRPEGLWALPVAGLGMLTGFTVWFCLRALEYPYQLLHGDGWMYLFARRLAAGEPLYKPLADFPLGTCNYPPLPLLLAAATFPLTGVSYAAGRIWSLLATLAVAAVLFAWVRRAGGQRLAAAVAALAWLGAPYVYRWAPQFRADLPGLAFSLAGVYLVWRRWESRTLYASALLFALGLYCKQSFVAAPAAAILALFVARRYRHGASLAGLLLAVGGVPFLVINAATGGAFWVSLVPSNVNPFDLGRLGAQVIAFLRTYPVLAGLTAALLVAWALKRWLPSGQPSGPSPNALVTVYVVLALCTGALAGKAGAWENYFLEPLAAVCLGSGLALARLRSSPRGRWLAPALVLVQVVLMWHTPAAAARLMREESAANRAVLPLVRSTPGIVLSEDAGLLVGAGKPVPYYDFQLTQLALAGRWDQSWEVGGLRSGAFPLVILESDTRFDVEQYGRYSRAFVSALDYGYRLAGRVGKFHIYRPAPLARERRAHFVDGPALVGHTLPPLDARPGQALSLDLVWQVARPTVQPYTSFLHLLDENGQGQTGHDLQPWDGLYPTTRWAQDEMVRMTYTLTLPIDLPAGLYTLRTGWYDANLERLRTEGGADSVAVAVVSIPSVSAGAQEQGEAAGAEFEGGVRLARYSLIREPSALRLTLTWEPGGFLDRDYAVFVHLTAADSPAPPLAQGDGPPFLGRWPTSLWQPGLAVHDPHTIPLPAGLSAGRYVVWVGFYEPATGLRLPLVGGGDAVRLAEVALP